jgi:hypothetical protein
MIGDLRTLDDLAVSEHHVAVDEGREAVGLNASAIDVDPLELLGGAKQLGEITPRIASASAACASTSSGFAATKVTLGAATCISGIHPTPMPVTTIFFCCADEVGRHDLPLQLGDPRRQRRQVACERLDGRAGILRLGRKGGEKQGRDAEFHKPPGDGRRSIRFLSLLIEIPSIRDFQFGVSVRKIVPILI